jgi:hypothetical protein
MAHDQAQLRERMAAYLDPSMDWADFAALNTGLSKDAGMFKPATARTKLLKTEKLQASAFRRYALYPLDNRWCYYSAKSPLWNRPRPELLAQRPEGESFLIVRRFAERPREGKPGFLTSALPDYHLLRPNAVAIPLRLTTAPAELPEDGNGQTGLPGPSGLSLAVTAGWGHLQKEDIVMPGSGVTNGRKFSESEKQAIAEGASELGMDPNDVLSILGGDVVDIYLNNESHWAAVPLAVWEYTIGGYLVLKKWLSYRDRSILGREITKDEAREFTHMVRRIAAMLLMEPALDTNYAGIKSVSYRWPQAETQEEPLIPDTDE